MIKMIKSYTNLEQSKELAKILPLESADMYYSLTDGEQKPHLGFDYNFVKVQTGLKLLTPCWSLAALLDCLPVLEDRNPTTCKDIRYNKWHIVYHSTASLECIDTERYDSLIDACYEMIIQLHENKML